MNEMVEKLYREFAKEKQSTLFNKQEDNKQFLKNVREFAKDLDCFVCVAQ